MFCNIELWDYNKGHHMSRHWTLLEHLFFFFKKSKFCLSCCKCSIYGKLERRKLLLLEQKKGGLLIFHIRVLSIFAPCNYFLGCVLLVEWRSFRDSYQAQPWIDSYPVLPKVQFRGLEFGRGYHRDMWTLPFSWLFRLSLYYTGFHPFRGKCLFEKPRKAMKILLRRMQVSRYCSLVCGIHIKNPCTYVESLSPEQHVCIISV